MKTVKTQPTSKSGRSRFRVRGLATLALLVLSAAIAVAPSAATPPELADHPLLQPIDAQNWVDQPT